jgi:hypothetical protein
LSFSRSHSVGSAFNKDFQLLIDYCYPLQDLEPIAE